MSIEKSIKAIAAKDFKWLTSSVPDNSPTLADLLDFSDEPDDHEVPSVENVDRSDTSIINIKRAKETLRFTGRRAYSVMFLKDGKQRNSAWFNSRTRAHQALAIVRSKGYQAIIYVD